MILKLGLPKGSLQESTFNIFKKAGFNINSSSRSYYPGVDDPEIAITLVRAQEMPRYVAEGIFDDRRLVQHRRRRGEPLRRQNIHQFYHLPRDGK